MAIWHQSRRMPARGGMAPKTPLPPDSDGLDSAAARVAELRLRLIGARHHHDLDLVIAGIEAALAECELDPSSSPLSPRMASVRAELRRLHGQAMEARHPRAAVHCDVGDAAEYEVEARSPRVERQLSLPRLEEFATGTKKHSLALPALANRDSLAYALCAVTLVLCFALLIGRAAAP